MLTEVLSESITKPPEDARPWPHPDAVAHCANRRGEAPRPTLPFNQQSDRLSAPLRPGRNVRNRDQVLVQPDGHRIGKYLTYELYQEERCCFRVGGFNRRGK